MRHIFAVGFNLLLLVLAPGVAHGLDLVVDGKPVATIVADVDDAPSSKPAKAQKPAKSKGKLSRTGTGDAMAARTLADWIEKITGARLPIAESAPDGTAAIYVGAAAVRAGLNFDGIDSPSHEALRVVCDGKKILLGGQDGNATVKAACRLLEELGCRYYMEGELGEVYPHATTLRVGELNLREKPGLDYRTIWGSVWSGNTLWKIWNGLGGRELSMGHAWGGIVSKDLFDKHPDYFALRKGERQKGDWLCTSNPEVRRIVAESLMQKIAEGNLNPSISPPDGIGYCECEKCRAQDDPASIEPSSGRVSVTNRYLDFYNEVAREVATKYPDSLLNFYCYADYSQAPTGNLKAEPNLVAWIAPLRYCRIHRISAPNCPSRMQLNDMIEAWSKAARHIAYRTYNYDLAECLVPFSMQSVWAHDIPYLKAHGCIGINLESLASWQIYGPHLYLSLRLAYDPSISAQAAMDDYYEKFYGPAAPHMKAYWSAVDDAFSTLNAHSGSFYLIQREYTPERIAQLRALLDQAAAAVKNEKVYAARVAMHAEGFQNAVQYMQLFGEMNTGHLKEMLGTYNQLYARTEAQAKAGYGNHYTPGYLKRFVGKQVVAASEAGAPPKQLAQVLPDRWHYMPDPKDEGLTHGFAAPEFDDSNWKTVATFSDTLDAQGLPDEKTILWYRTTIDVPAVKGKETLFFTEVDGQSASVFVNGKPVGEAGKKRVPFEVDVTGAIHAGKNTVAVRIDHTQITELLLGGIIRPVFLFENAP